MRAFVLILILSLPASCTASAGQKHQFLVTTDWVAERLGSSQLVLLHVGSEEEYREAHLPGAVFVDRSALSTPHEEGGIVLEMPSVDQLESAFEAAGVSDDSWIVIYWGVNWISPSARVYLTLDYLGMGERTFLLDGGMPSWVSEGRETTTIIPRPPRGNFTPRPRNDVLVDLQWVREHLNDRNVQLIDSRNREFYTSEKKGNASRAGHLPGATSVPYHEMVDESLKFKPAQELQRLLTEGGMNEGKTAISYCHIGQQACVTYLVARSLGFDARMFDGSMNEWSRHEELPLVSETGQ
ncbi:MAG: sulfurtransferase [Ignavibacteria bacterium]|nr:sulfurtransferase [Ignavibacteria bacterium]